MAVLSSAVGLAFRCVILREHSTKIKWCVNTLEVCSTKNCGSERALLKMVASNMSTNASAIQIEYKKPRCKWRNGSRGIQMKVLVLRRQPYSHVFILQLNLSIVICNPLFFCFVFFRCLWLLWGTQAQVQETGWQHLPRRSRGGSRELQPYIVL